MKIHKVNEMLYINVETGLEYKVISCAVYGGTYLIYVQVGETMIKNFNPTYEKLESDEIRILEKEAASFLDLWIKKLA